MTHEWAICYPASVFTTAVGNGKMASGFGEAHSTRSSRARNPSAGLDVSLL